MRDRRPALPIETDLDTARVRVGPGGVRYAEYEFVYSEYDAGRIRAGYCCIECGEAQETPFPEKCWICHFPMKEKQAAKFAESFEGYTTVGPSRSLEELRAEDEELRARAAHRKNKPTSNIWVPRAL